MTITDLCRDFFDFKIRKDRHTTDYVLTVNDPKHAIYSKDGDDRLIVFYVVFNIDFILINSLAHMKFLPTFFKFMSNTGKLKEPVELDWTSYGVWFYDTNGNQALVPFIDKNKPWKPYTIQRNSDGLYSVRNLLVKYSITPYVKPSSNSNSINLLEMI